MASVSVYECMRGGKIGVRLHDYTNKLVQVITLSFVEESLVSL